MGEALAPAACLPDPLVGLVPVLTQPVGGRGDRAPDVVGHVPDVLVESVDRIDDLAVDVELELVGGVVADADRPGSSVAVEVVEGLFGDVRPAVDAVEHLQRPRSVGWSGPKAALEGR